MNRESKRILIVDDERDLRDLLADILVLGGHQISTASNALDAFAILKNGVFDLIISDVNMPHIDGPHFYVYAAEDYPYLVDRFLFITGFVTEELTEFLTRHNLKCIEKPIRVVDFLQQVNAHLVERFNAVSDFNKAVRSRNIVSGTDGRF